MRAGGPAPAWAWDEIAQLEDEIERLREEWRKADDGWIAAKRELSEQAELIFELKAEIEKLRNGNR